MKVLRAHSSFSQHTLPICGGKVKKVAENSTLVVPSGVTEKKGVAGPVRYLGKFYRNIKAPSDIIFTDL